MNTCQRKKRRPKMRNLKAGEPIPEGAPNYRSRTVRGYIHVFWAKSPALVIRAYEHRVVVGNPIGQVHHRNGDKSDNRPENLEVCASTFEHKSHHIGFDMNEAIRMYESGMSTTAIATRVGSWGGNISRLLRARGVQMRPSGKWRKRKDVDDARV